MRTLQRLEPSWWRVASEDSSAGSYNLWSPIQSSTLMAPSPHHWASHGCRTSFRSCLRRSLSPRPPWPSSRRSPWVKAAWYVNRAVWIYVEGHQLIVHLGCCFQSYLRLRPRRLLSLLVVDKARQQTHPDSRQRSLVQHYARHPHDPPCFRRHTRGRRAVLHCCCCRLCRFHNPHLHPRLLRRQSIQGWTLEFGPLQHVYR